jgi:hypothetical protein
MQERNVVDEKGRRCICTRNCYWKINREICSYQRQELAEMPNSIMHQSEICMSQWYVDDKQQKGAHRSSSIKAQQQRVNLHLYSEVLLLHTSQYRKKDAYHITPMTLSTTQELSITWLVKNAAQTVKVIILFSMVQE